MYNVKNVIEEILKKKKFKTKLVKIENLILYPPFLNMDKNIFVPFEFYGSFDLLDDKKQTDFTAFINCLREINLSESVHLQLRGVIKRKRSHEKAGKIESFLFAKFQYYLVLKEIKKLPDLDIEDAPGETKSPEEIARIKAEKEAQKKEKAKGG